MGDSGLSSPPSSLFSGLFGLAGEGEDCFCFSSSFYCSSSFFYRIESLLECPLALWNTDVPGVDLS